MGKPTGFMEYNRELPDDRSPLDRIEDWDEFHLHFDEKRLQTQGSRCMDCGVPFCHTGTRLPETTPFASGCPINNLIPEWNDCTKLTTSQSSLGGSVQRHVKGLVF